MSARLPIYMIENCPFDFMYIVYYVLQKLILVSLSGPKVAQFGLKLILWTAQGLIQPKAQKSRPGPGPKSKFENGPSLGPAQKMIGPNRPWAAKFRPKPIPRNQWFLDKK